ncbi:MAG TPA: FecR family protein [Flavobacteriales bacterium]|nr:FecR family protein [Flavobacteriales bacterium]
MDYNGLITKFLSGNATAQEAVLLMDWRKQDPLNEALFQKSEHAWKNTAVLNDSYDPDTSKGWEGVQQKIAVNQLAKQASYVQPWMKVAATLVLLAGVTWVMTLFIFDQDQKGVSSLAKINPVKKVVVTEQPEFVELESGANTAKIVLPDSTHVYLNKNSKITYPEKFNGNERPVYLSGEAFFEVSENKKMPFIIYCAGTKTEVTGTSFNVRGYENEKQVEVSVVTGSVAFSDARKGHDKKMMLAANDMGTFRKGDATMGKSRSKKTKWWQKTNLKKGWDNLFKRMKNKLK